ncbi:hypothetical protein AB1K89_12710 [Sporosarcina sp. 179-K 8C2 HS]
MIIQYAKHERTKQKTTKKLTEWESPKWIDIINGGTTGERRL